MTCISREPRTDVGPERIPEVECISLDALLFWTQRKEFFSPWKEAETGEQRYYFTSCYRRCLISNQMVPRKCSIVLALIERAELPAELGRVFLITGVNCTVWNVSHYWSREEMDEQQNNGPRHKKQWSCRLSGSSEN